MERWVGAHGLGWGRRMEGRGWGRVGCAYCTCVIAVTTAAARGVQGLQEGLQWDMDQGLADSISSSAVWGCHHGCCCLWGPGQVCCWRSSG